MNIELYDRRWCVSYGIVRSTDWMKEDRGGDEERAGVSDSRHHHHHQHHDPHFISFLFRCRTTSDPFLFLLSIFFYFEFSSSSTCLISQFTFPSTLSSFLFLFFFRGGYLKILPSYAFWIPPSKEIDFEKLSVQVHARLIAYSPLRPRDESFKGEN